MPFDLGDARYGQVVNLAPLYGTTGQELVGGQDASGGASISSDNVQDWTVYCQRGVSGIPAFEVAWPVNLIVQWGTGGSTQREIVALPPQGAFEPVASTGALGAGAVALHVRGTSVRTSFAGGVPNNFTPTTRPAGYIDRAIINVAKGRPVVARTHSFLAAQALGAPSVLSTNHSVPGFATRARIVVNRSDVLSWPQPPVRVGWISGGTNFPVFEGVITPGMEFTPIASASRLSVRGLDPTPQNEFFSSWVQWELVL